MSLTVQFWIRNYITYQDTIFCIWIVLRKDSGFLRKNVADPTYIDNEDFNLLKEYGYFNIALVEMSK